MLLARVVRMRPMNRVLPWLALSAAFGCAEDTRSFDAWRRDGDRPRPYLAFGECKIAEGSTCTSASVEVLRETRLDADVRLTCVFAAAANTVSPLIDDPVCQAALQS